MQQLTWLVNSSGPNLVQIGHGYDQAGNRLWRQDLAAGVAGQKLDELYTYDSADRLTNLDRGQLNSPPSAGLVTGMEDFAQQWGLDAAGNWASFNQGSAPGNWTLQQARTFDLANELLSASSWAAPAFTAPAT